MSMIGGMSTATSSVYRREVSDRPNVAAVRRAVLDAVRRGAREAAVPLPPGGGGARGVCKALGLTGFRWTQVEGEDGPYAVVHW